MGCVFSFGEEPKDGVVGVVWERGAVEPRIDAGEEDLEDDGVSIAPGCVRDAIRARGGVGSAFESFVYVVGGDVGFDVWEGVGML